MAAEGQFDKMVSDRNANEPENCRDWEGLLGVIRSSLLQAKQPQVSQPFLIQEILQAPLHLCSPPPSSQRVVSPLPDLFISSSVSE